MKNLQLILILLIIGYSFSDDSICSNFESNKSQKCGSIKTSCRFANNKCFETGDCTTALTDSTACSKIIPVDFNKYKCDMGTGSCNSKLKECSDYDITKGDTCSKLSPGTGENIRCDINIDTTTNTDTTTCGVHHKECEGLDSSLCLSNIPENYNYKCVWDTTCKTTKRECTDNFRGKTTCSELTPTPDGVTLGKTCISLNGNCFEGFETCSQYTGADSSICTGITPLTEDKSGYNNLKKCVYGTSCTPEDKICSDFKKESDNPNLCAALKSTNDKKRCVYDYLSNPSDNPCKEEYKTCETYNQEDTKTKEGCENIILIETAKKCVFSGNQCVTRNKDCSDYKPGQPFNNCTDIVLTGNKHCRYEEPSSAGAGDDKCLEDYNSCDDYKGNDKKTCKSILSENCYLDKDSICMKKPDTIIRCTAANVDEDTCLHVAVPTDSNKKCLYYNGVCREDYEKCEDYKGTDDNACEAIQQYNGKKCSFINGKCRSIKKDCSDTHDERECILISKTGVDDPTRYRCDYSSGSCVERNMYCSDYTGDYTTGICSLIKPYDLNGNSIEVFSKCEDKDDGIGCQRVLKKCNEASTPSLCETISTQLKEKTDNTKYCVFINGACKEDYTKCEYYEKEEGDDDETFGTKCGNIIPTNYINNHCHVADGKCEDEANSCDKFDTLFDANGIGDFCLQSSSLCSYSPTPGICSNKNDECDKVTFANTDYVRKEEVCKSINISDQNKICSLKDDGSGCEIIDKPPTPLEPGSLDVYDGSDDTSDTSNKESKSQDESKATSWGGKINGIYFGFIILCFLI